VISMLKRRPCSVQDICTGLGITRSEAMQHLTTLLEMGAFVPESKGGVTYYRPLATT
jgi:DNA-binding IclR family transcriptional regulator